MQQTPDTPSSTLLRIPAEILPMILCHTMRSEIPIHLEHLLELGKRVRKLRNSKAASKLKGCSSAYSESWFLKRLGLGQSEHFQDWLLINSTCRKFRAWGKKAFFSEKIFFGREFFWQNTWAKSLAAENVAIARGCIHHVIVQYARARFMVGIATIPENALPCLRSMSLLVRCADADVLPTLNSLQLFRFPLPEEYSNSLRDFGLPVDQLQVDIIYGRACADNLERLISFDCSALKALLRNREHSW